MNTIKIDTSQMSEVDKKLLFSTFLEAIQTFYDDPGNRKAFEEWQREQQLKSGARENAI